MYSDNYPASSNTKLTCLPVDVGLDKFNNCITTIHFRMKISVGVEMLFQMPWFFYFKQYFSTSEVIYHEMIISYGNKQDIFPFL